MKKLVIIKALLFTLLVIVMTKCKQVYPIVNKIEVGIQKEKLQVKKITTWTEMEPSERRDNRTIVPDTLIAHFDMLGRCDFFEMKFQERNKRYHYSYDDNDSLVLKIYIGLLTNGELESDTTIYDRGIEGRLISMKKKSRNGYFSTVTEFLYSENGRIESKIVKNLKGVKKKQWIYSYQDSLRQTIVKYTPYKSGGYSELFIDVDTIHVNQDSTITKITDYNTNSHGVKYLPSTQCYNCIKYLKTNDDGKLIEEIRIRRPNDTIFFSQTSYDKRLNEESTVIIIPKNTSTFSSSSIMDSQNNEIRIKYYTNDKLKSTKLKKIEYYNDNRINKDTMGN